MDVEFMIKDSNEIVFYKRLLSVMVLFVLLISIFREFDHDEFEAIHTSWKIWNGQLLYIDFFQHHHPGLYYVLYPYFTVFNESIGGLIFLRICVFLIFLGILNITYNISELLFRDRALSWLSILLLSSIPMFWHKAIEIRPDIPQVFFALLSILYFFKHRQNPRNSYRFFSSICLGLSFLFLQKTLFIIAGLGLIQLFYLYSRELSVSSFLKFWLCFFVTLSPYYLYTVLTSQFDSYVFWNWIINMNFMGSHPAIYTILDSFAYSHFVWIFYVVGLYLLLKKRHFELTLLSMILLGTTFLVKMPYRQYFMPFVPIMCIISSYGMNVVLNWRPKKMIVILTSAVSIIYAIYSIIKYPNRPQLNKVQWVLNHTESSDLVYDGDAYFNLYREDIDFFWFSAYPTGGGLGTYQKLKSYDYDLIESIKNREPKIVSTLFLQNTIHPYLIENYRRSKEYPDLFIRKD